MQPIARTNCVYVMIAIVLMAFTNLTQGAPAPEPESDLPYFVPEPKGRGTVGIITSCLVTWGLCLWTAIHLDVPEPGDSFFDSKLFLTVIYALAPEILTFGAIQQYVQVKQRLKFVNHEMFGDGAEAGQWTMTDGFYATMGGYVLSVPGGVDRTLNPATMVDLACKGLMSFPRSARAAINDKSKTDALGKALTCLQIMWFAAQCLARLAQHLPLTLLELETLAYTLFALMTYGAYWYKPRDVRVPTTLVLRPEHREKEDAGAVVDELCEQSPTAAQLQVQDDRASRLVWAAAGVVCVLYGAFHLLAWLIIIPVDLEKYMWGASAGVISVTGLVFFVMSGWLQRLSWVQAIFFFFYAFARLIIIVYCFLGLETLPSNAFETVRWTDFVPHL